MTAMTTPEAPAEPAPASRARAIDARQLAEALPGAFRKLDPRLMWRNPVMLIVEVGAEITTVLAIAEPFTGGAGSSGGSAVPATFTAGIALWLWLTVVFANLAESVAEGRGKAQADSLRKTRTSTMAHVVASYDASGDPGAERAELREVSSADLTLGDMVVVVAGESSPGDGDVVLGHRLHRRVGHHGRVRAGGPRVRRRPQRRHGRHSGAERPDRGAHHLEARRDVRRPHDRPRRGRVASAHAERDRAQHPAGEPHDRLRGRGPHAQPDRLLLGGDRERAGAHRAARLPDPHHHRRAPLRHRHRRHGPARAAQRARDVGPRGRGGGRRHHAAARQDRHHHLRQPPGQRADPGGRRDGRGARPGRGHVVARGPDAGGIQRRRPRRRAGRGHRLAAARGGRAVHRADPHVGRRPARRAHRPEGRVVGRVRVARGGRPRAADARPRRAHPDRRGRLQRRRHPARRRDQGRRRIRPRARRRAPQGRREGRPQGALRGAARDGHPHGDDHGRQPAHRPRHRRRGRGRRPPRRGRPRTSSRSSARSRREAAWSP